jgi:hypothetical protein
LLSLPQDEVLKATQEFEANRRSSLSQQQQQQQPP